MPYFQLRITCSQLRTKHVVLRSIRALIRHYKLECYSTGYEELNSFGEPCDPQCDDCDEIQEKGLENVIKLATNEKADSIEQNLLRREKLLLKDKFKQKMYDYIDEERKEGDTEKRVIWCLIFEYYRKIEKPINFSVIEGYCNLWLADHGALSANSAFNLAHNNNSN